MDNVVGSGLLNEIKDPNLLKALRNIGFTGITCEEARNWFLNKNILICIYPSFGDKVGYDTFEVRGYLFEVDIIQDNGGIFLGNDYANRFINSYRSSIGLPEDNEEYRQKEFKTYSSALQESLRYAVGCYYHCLNYDINDKINMLKESDIPKFPKYGRIVRDMSNHRYYLFVFKGYSTKIKAKAIYKCWSVSKHIPKDLEIEVAWDGKEFIVSESNGFKPFINKQFLKATINDFVYDKYLDKQITFQDLGKYMKDEKLSEQLIFGN